MRNLHVTSFVVLYPSQARDVFGAENMADLRGSFGVGHVRYPTSGCNSVEEAQASYALNIFVEAVSSRGRHVMLDSGAALLL